MVKKKTKKQCINCDGRWFLVKAFLIAGSYIFTWGLIGSANWADVLKSPLFWGLILILTGSCLVRKLKT